MSRESYPNAPITEAIIALRFDTHASWTDELANEVAGVLRGIFPVVKGEIREYAFHLDLNSGAAGSTPTRSRRLIASENGTFQIAIGPNIVSVHALRPYPGWPEFTAHADQAFALYSRAAQAGSLREVVVRYLDRIELPSHDQPLSTYFTCAATPPPGFSLENLRHHSVLQGTEATSGLTISLTLATAPPTEDGRPAVLYDLSLTQPMSGEHTSASWRVVADALHSRQRDIFETSITDATRELFR